jgi:hypothetical protein
MDVGLRVEFDGVKNVVLMGEVKEYPIGGMACEYARLQPTELKEVILSNPYFQDEDLNENGGMALAKLYDSLREKFGVVTAGMVIADFSDLMFSYKTATDDELQGCIKKANDAEGAKNVKSYILEDTGFDEFGTSTIGQAMLMAYFDYASSYAVFKHSFTMLVSDEEYEEKQVDGFWSLYSENADCQQIDFRILLYEHGFHSVYNIKSSISLIMFEAAHAIDAGTKFVKCKNCGRYFVPVGRSDSLYCGYPSPQDPTKQCRDVGANATRARKMKSDTLTQEYRRLYMRLKMALKRHPDNEELGQQLTELTDGMKLRRQQQKDSVLSTDDILEWLHAFDEGLESQ